MREALPPAVRYVVASELRGPADEGMRVWLKSFESVMSAHGCDVVNLPLGGRERTAVFDPRNLLRVRRVRPDVLLYVPYSGLTRASLGRLKVLQAAARRARATLVVLQSDGPVHTHHVLRPAAAIYASRRLMHEVGGLAPIEGVAYPVVDRSRFRPGSGGEEVRTQLRLSADEPLILHVGHIKASRNLGVLAELSTAGIGKVVMIASTSTDVDEALAAELVQAGVTVVRRFLPDIECWYRAADVYVFPVESRLGSIELPLSVVEALASGTPVVTTRFGALPELFQEQAGLVYSDSIGIVERVRHLLVERPEQRVPLEPLDPTVFASAVNRVARAGRTRRGARVLVLSGIDGAGKSTQISRLRREFEERGMQTETLWCRWDPFLAKPFVKMLDRASRGRGSARTGTPAVASSADARRRIRARLLSLPSVRAAWRGMMVLDYGLRLAPKVRRARRKNDVLLLDRYWHDVMVDFSFGGDLVPAPALLRRLLPDPDEIIILDLPEEVAMARKPEAPDLLYLTERRRLYQEVAVRFDGSIVDAAQADARVTADLWRAIERTGAGDGPDG